VTPDLRQLVAAADLAELPELIGQLEIAKALALARLAAPTPALATVPARNLSATEAARRLGVSLPYLYKHAASWPVARRLGKRVVFDSAGLEAWNSGQHPSLTAGRLEG
jgi:hypothetical protein